jgi:hypothetical protein
MKRSHQVRAGTNFRRHQSPKFVPTRRGGADEGMVERDEFHLAGDAFERDGTGLRAAHAHHLVVDSLGEHLGGVRAEASGEDAVVRRRDAAALQVAQHHHGINIDPEG